MAKVTYKDINRTVQCDEPDMSLLDVSIQSRIPHIRECGGNGQCTTCRIKITQGQENISKPTPSELRIARKRHWEPAIRLACQCFVTGDVEIQRLLWTNIEVSHLQLEEVEQGMAKELEVVVLIGDLRDFTSISSDNLNFDMAHMLNRIYTVLGNPILINNGVIYQYVGDEIIGIFGLSGGSREKNCQDALRAALGMQYAIDRLNYMELKAFETTFQLGIGINYGKAYVGHLGHPKHRQFAVVGDTINIASRIQNQTKEVGAKILIPHAVYRALDRNALDIGKWYKTVIRGKKNPLFLYEVLGFSDVDMNLELQGSLDFILRNEHELTTNFFAKLSKESPEIRALFKTDIKTHGKVLTHTLAGIVHALSRPDYLAMGLEKLSHSHASYGVKLEHYPIVLSMLTEIIEGILMGQYHQKTIDAWKKALATIIEQMKGFQSSANRDK